MGEIMFQKFKKSSKFIVVLFIIFALLMNIANLWKVFIEILTLLFFDVALLYVIYIVIKSVVKSVKKDIKEREDE